MNRLDYMVQVEDLHASPELRARIEALAGTVKRPRRRFRPWMGVCACLAVVFLLGVGILTGQLPLLRFGGSAGAGGHNEGSTFMSYAGPVFPLTLGEENDAITAQRHTTLDFSPWEPVWVESDAREEGGYWSRSTDILVTDAYTLTNHSDTDQEVTVYYPFAAALEELAGLIPTLSLDGTELETTLTVGGMWPSYTAGSWEDYRDMLSGGDYMEAALGSLPGPGDIPVIVYEFTDPYGPADREEASNPSIRAAMELDYNKTAVLSYGFQGGAYDREAGTMLREYSIPEPRESSYGSSCYLLILGEDVDSLTTGGYVTGGVDPDTPVLENSGVTVTRYESDLDTMFRTILSQALERRLDESDERYVGLDFETCYRVILERFYQSGLPENLSEWQGTGSLEDFISESFYIDRVNWVSARITVPAGESLTVEAAFTKASSHDYACSNARNQGISGYDLVTKLGSNLTCTEQTATLEDRGLIEIIRQNFGFDLENGVNTVTLDPGTDRYYLEVRRIPETE